MSFEYFEYIVDSFDFPENVAAFCKNENVFTEIMTSLVDFKIETTELEEKDDEIDDDDDDDISLSPFFRLIFYNKRIVYVFHKKSEHILMTLMTLL